MKGGAFAPRLRLNASQTLAAGFGALILCGAVLLNLPAASADGRCVGFLNALFTATSATCVTGLAVVNTASHWTLFGKGVILGLVQVGGLGVMTVIATGLLFFRRRVSLRERLVIQASFNQDKLGGMVRLVREVLRLTVTCEAVGAVLLTMGFYFGPGQYTLLKAVKHGVFHAVSAFCNAGFDVLGERSLVGYQTNPLINLTIMGLIVAGGIGYPVWVEVLEALKKRRRERTPARVLAGRLSVHSKIALVFTAVLLLGGAGMFLLLEWDNPATMGNLSLSGKLWTALFQSVTLRTAGFFSIDQAGLREASLFFSCLLMFVGGSPAGTAGGVKTVTAGVILFSMLSVLRGRERIEAFRRNLALELLQKALSVVTLLLGVVLCGTMILTVTEADSAFAHSFLDLLFECMSAAATVGNSTGITPFLSPIGKVVIILSMFVGRLGPVTVAMALSIRLHRADGDLQYPDTKVIVG